MNTSLPLTSQTKMLTAPKNSAGKVYLEFRKEHVTRHELLRFESCDVYNDQWVIRTWDGRHLAVDDDGRLIVKVIIHHSSNDINRQYLYRYLSRLDVLRPNFFVLFHLRIC